MTCLLNLYTSLSYTDKAGKSKCKIKIDNSSVILLNDKSDFPRLSPRPSLLNLVEKVGGRRKSMQPQCLASADRDMFLACKDTRKGIFKTRARSNSESGRGTLSSPEDCATGGGVLGAMGQYNHQNSLGEGGSAYSGLNTPIVIDRKASLNSPMMASHVRHILNSLDAKVNQMNGSGGRLGGGRNSLDADSIAEEGPTTDKRRGSSLEDGDDGCSTKSGGSSTGGGNRRNSSAWSQRLVDSIEETAEGPTNAATKSDPTTVPVGLRNKRRASLQPQRCVDEDDADILNARRTFTLPDSEYINPYAGNGSSFNNDIHSGMNKISPQKHGCGDSPNKTSPWSPTARRTSSSSQVSVMPQPGGQFFPPTTIHVDPPSTTSNYSLSSSTGSAGAGTARGISPIAEQSLDGSSQSVAGPYEGCDSANQLTTLCKAPQVSREDEDNDGRAVRAASDDSAVEMEPLSPRLQGRDSPNNQVQTKESSPIESAGKTFGRELESKPANQKSSVISAEGRDSTPRPVGVSLKPKTLRTPSDIENQNNLTVTEPGSRTSSIEETGGSSDSPTKLDLGNFCVISETKSVPVTSDSLCGNQQKSPSPPSHANGSKNSASVTLPVAMATPNSSHVANGTNKAKDV